MSADTVERLESMRRKDPKLALPKLHDDLVETNLYHSVNLRTPDGAFIRDRNLHQLRKSIETQNATRASSDQEFLILLSPPSYGPDAFVPQALAEAYEQANPPKPGAVPTKPTPSKVEAWIRKKGGINNAARSVGKIMLPHLPPPVASAVIGIYTRRQLIQMREAGIKQERDAQRASKAGKEVEITWTVEPHDLVWSLKKVREWLQDGKRVTTVLVRKRKRVAPLPEICERLLESIKTEVRSALPAGVTMKEAGAMGLAMQLEFIPDAKASSASKVGNTKIDVDIVMPWLSNEKQLQLHSKTLFNALKKNKNVRIKLTMDEPNKVKDVLSREEILSFIRSRVRTTKDALITDVEGDETTGPMTMVVCGTLKENRREVEIDPEINEKDYALRLGWIAEWITQRRSITVFAGTKPKAGLLQDLEKAAVVASTSTDGGQTAYVLEPKPIPQAAPAKPTADLAFKASPRASPTVRRNLPSRNSVPPAGDSLSQLLQAAGRRKQVR